LRRLTLRIGDHRCFKLRLARQRLGRRPGFFDRRRGWRLRLTHRRRRRTVGMVDRDWRLLAFGRNIGFSEPQWLNFHSSF
jgi:hypothetical protein